MILRPGLSFSASNRRCAGGGEVGGVGRRVFLGRQRRAGLGERLLERGDAVAAERVVLRERRDEHAGLADRHRVGDRVLRRIAAGAEDVAVPFVAGDLVGDRRLDDEDLLVLLGDRQHGDRRRRRGGADRDVGVVVLIGLGERGLGEVGLALVVLDDDVDLAPVDLHRALGRVFEAEPQPGLGLLGVGFERPGPAVDQRDIEIGRRSGGGAAENARRDREAFDEIWSLPLRGSRSSSRRKRSGDDRGAGAARSTGRTSPTFPVTARMAKAGVTVKARGARSTAIAAQTDAEPPPRRPASAIVAFGVASRVIHRARVFPRATGMRARGCS